MFTKGDTMLLAEHSKLVDGAVSELQSQFSAHLGG